MSNTTTSLTRNRLTGSLALLLLMGCSLYFQRVQRIGEDGAYGRNLFSILHHDIEKVKERPMHAFLTSDRYRSRYPGRFELDQYPDIKVSVEFPGKHSPYVNSSCAPGLVCSFSDEQWFSTGYNPPPKVALEGGGKSGSVIVSMESPGHPFHSNLHSYPDGGLATTSFESDIPISYYPFEDIYTPVSTEIKHWRVLHIASNCGNVQSDRNGLVSKLDERGILDSYGGCHHNKDYSATQRAPPGGHSGLEVEKLARSYAFVTAFENSYSPGYITEKLWRPLRNGVLPLYLGSPAEHLFPEGAFVDVNAFDSWDQLIDFIEYLAVNKDEYYKMHSWRNERAPEVLTEFWQFAREDFNCRLCRWAAENVVLKND